MRPTPSFIFAISLALLAMLLGDPLSLRSRLDAWLVDIIATRQMSAKLKALQVRALEPLSTCGEKWGEDVHCVEDCHVVELKEPVATLAVAAWGKKPVHKKSGAWLKSKKNIKNGGGDQTEVADVEVVLPCATREDCSKVLDFCYVCACEGVDLASIMSCAMLPTAYTH